MWGHSLSDLSEKFNTYCHFLTYYLEIYLGFMLHDILQNWPSGSVTEVCKCSATQGLAEHLQLVVIHWTSKFLIKCHLSFKNHFSSSGNFKKLTRNNVQFSSTMRLQDWVRSLTKQFFP